MAEQLRDALQERETRGTRIGASALMDRVEAELGTEMRFPLKASGPKKVVPSWAIGLAAALVVVLVIGGTALSIWMFADPGSRDVVDRPVPTVSVPAVPTTTTPQTTTTLDNLDTVPAPDDLSGRVYGPGGRVYDPALSGEERVELVSEWAQERDLLTGDDVVAAFGDSMTKVVDAASPEVAMDPDPWKVGFRSPFPSDEAVLDEGVSYVLHREVGSRTVILYVSEYVSHDPDIMEMYATMEAGEGRRNTADERYDPSPIGVDSFAYETNGGSGALDRLVVVNTGEALVVIVASPASPDFPDRLTEVENLTREQVDNLVRVAVEKLLGGS